MFSRRMPVFIMTLAVSSTALAGAEVEISSLTPANGPGGVGYLPGSIVEFQVSVSQDESRSTPVRIVRLDFTGSDPALVFLGPDDFPTGSPDGILEFVFDFSTLDTAAMYNLFPGYPAASIEYTGVGYIPGFMLEIPEAGTGPLVLGTGQVELPMSPGTYTLDALNAAASDPLSHAAHIRFGFGGPDPETAWSAVPGFGDGLITGAPLTLTVVPWTCPGDFNSDTRSDLLDFAVLQRNFLQAANGPEDGDADGNGMVGLTDLAILVANIGAICGS